MAILPPPAGDFVNDIIIVCTLAIIIGQNLRSDLKEVVECRRRDIREYVARLPKGDLITNEERIRSLYDWIKNFSVMDLIQFMAFFYICIFASVFLDLIGINERLKVIPYWLQFPVENIRFFFEIIVWMSLMAYGIALLNMRRLFNEFIGKTYNLCTSLDLIATGLNIGTTGTPAITESHPNA